jgi:hypothetical protein
MKVAPIEIWRAEWRRPVALSHGDVTLCLHFGNSEFDAQNVSSIQHTYWKICDEPSPAVECAINTELKFSER